MDVEDGTPQEQAVVWLRNIWGAVERINLTLEDIKREIKQQKNNNASN